jgi:hypothetical protein
MKIISEGLSRSVFEHTMPFAVLRRVTISDFFSRFLQISHIDDLRFSSSSFSIPIRSGTDSGVCQIKTSRKTSLRGCDQFSMSIFTDFSALDFKGSLAVTINASG